VGHLCHDEEFLKATADKPIYRKVWEMHSDGIAYKIIGKQLGIHKETVKKYLRKFRPMLQALIDKDENDDGSHSD
jgi:DNA-directed RNA polymerase specialized sigma24 family protein